MLLWRISNYATLDGFGGFYAAARWHTEGHRVVYLAETPAGSLVEALVHLELSAADLPRSYKLLKAEAPEDLTVQMLRERDLPPSWQKNLTATRTIGDEWLAARATALLRVPSVIVPETHNVLLNPEHADAARVRVVSCREYPWDERLF